MSENYLSIYAKSFSWAGFFLPKKIYKKCSILYDFCRSLDNIADQDLELEIKIKQFNEFKDKFLNKDTNDQIIIRMRELIYSSKISEKIVYDLFEGVESDLKKEVKINTKKELLIYSYRVAGTVGLMMAKILNVKKENSLKAAIDLGIAMQLTNISRDTVEDNKKNRKVCDYCAAISGVATASLCPKSDNIGIASHLYMYVERNELHVPSYLPKNDSASVLLHSITDIAVLPSSNEPLQIIFPCPFHSSIIVLILFVDCSTSCLFASSLKILTRTYGDLSSAMPNY